MKITNIGLKQPVYQLLKNWQYDGFYISETGYLVFRKGTTVMEISSSGSVYTNELSDYESVYTPVTIEEVHYRWGR